MKLFLILFLCIFSVTLTGQITFKGTVRDYNDNEKIPYAIICADTTDSFTGLSEYSRGLHALKPDSTRTDLNGYFELTSYLPFSVNLTIGAVGYVNITIKNINLESEDQIIELGDIYLPFRGDPFEGFKPPKGDVKRKDRRKQRKNWRKYGMPNWNGYAGDFLVQFQGKQNTAIEYPLHGSHKNFELKGICLIIDYVEFTKK
jgi:hypothetical protein